MWWRCISTATGEALGAYIRAAAHLDHAITPLEHRPDPDAAERRLRIGLVSDGFHARGVGRLIWPAMAAEQLELYFYSGDKANDRVRLGLKKLATRWCFVAAIDDAGVAEQIAADRIGVLIDMAGFGPGARLATMDRKLAPVVVKWGRGLVNIMGLAAYDYARRPPDYASRAAMRATARR